MLVMSMLAAPGGQYCGPSGKAPQQPTQMLLTQEGEAAQQQQRRNRPPGIWQRPQPGRDVSYQLPQAQHQQAFSSARDQQQNNTTPASGSTDSEPHVGDGRNLLRSLTFHRVLYVSEAFTSKRYNASSNMLRKNYENFVLLKHKHALVTPGPKKAKDFPRGLVIAYPSGHIVSAATRQHFVGLAHPPEALGGATNKACVTNNPRDGIQMYADWIRRKFRSHEIEPPCATNGHTRFLNFLTRADLPQPPQYMEPLEVFLEEFHDFLRLHFPHWSVVYDPEVSPVMAICRLQKGSKPEDAIAAAAAALAAIAKKDKKSTPDTPLGLKGQQRSPRGPVQPPTKLQRCSTDDASLAFSPRDASTSELPGSESSFVPVRLMLPLSQQPKHLWPPVPKILAYCRKEWALASATASAPGSSEAAAAMAELHVVLLIGAAHIVAHCRGSSTVTGEGNPDCVAETNTCQAATSAAVSDIWSLLRYFVGTTRERFSAKV